MIKNKILCLCLRIYISCYIHCDTAIHIRFAVACVTHCIANSPVARDGIFRLPGSIPRLLVPWRL